MSGDARRYSWPPFEPGNTAAEKHGAWSERKWRPIAERLLDDLEQTAPWTLGAGFAGTRWAWARTEAQLSLIADWVDEHGVIDDEGNVPACMNQAARLDATADKLRDRLGLSPLALGKLLGTLSAIDGPAVADGLAALKATGRALREAASGITADGVPVASGSPGAVSGEGAVTDAGSTTTDGAEGDIAATQVAPDEGDHEGDDEANDDDHQADDHGAEQA